MGVKNILAFLLALLLAACSSDAGQGRPACGTPPSRVVCLAPSAAELLFALDAGGLVVGTAEHSDEPAEARTLPRVGSYARPDLERVLTLRPDLCIAVQDGTPPQTLARLGELGIPVVLMMVSSVVSAPYTRPVLPRISSHTSGFFFCGMMDEPVEYASGSFT